MLKSSVLEMLRSFDRDELMLFEDFLKSPYHNKNNNVIKLFNSIKKYCPDFDNENLDKEIVWKNLYPEKKYNYGVMKNLIHELSKLGMKFIVIEEFEGNRLEKDTILLNGLNNRNIKKLFNVKMKEIERNYNKDTFNKEYFFVNDFYSEYSKMKWIKIYHCRANNIDAVTENDVISSSAMFIYSFLIYLFKYYNNVLSDSNDKNIPLDKNVLAVFLKEISPEIIDRLLEVVKQHSERDYKVLTVYRNMSLSQLNKKSIEHYLEFKKSLNKNIGVFSKWDVKDLSICLSNSLNNLDASAIDLEKEYFEISDTLLSSNGIFNRDGTMTAADFNLYIWRAFNANRFEAIETFANKFIAKIPAEMRDYSSSIAEAYVSFGEKNFRKTLEIISRSEHPTFISKVRFKQLKAKCLYELDEFELFENEYKTIYHFLRNNKSLSSKFKDDTKMIFDLIRKLFRLRQKYTQYEYANLKKEISRSFLNKSNWFAIKLNKLVTSKRVS